MKRARASGRGCLTNILLILLIIVLAVFIYKWIAGMGSARLAISKLEVIEKTGRSGEIIHGSRLVILNLSNTGNQSGNFTLDLDEYIEAQKLEGKNPAANPPIWSFTTEILFSHSDKWQGLANAPYWSGPKITPGALEITVTEGETLELECYLKTSRGWKIDIPEMEEAEENPGENVPQKLRINLIAPSGKTVSSEIIDL